MQPSETPGPTGGQGSESSLEAVETYNAWTVVNVVFHHLVDKGLHPVLGETGDPGAPAEALLRALGIQPRAEGDTRVKQGIHEHLSVLRETVLGPPV